MRVRRQFRDASAVSPVIAVILMVAITVVLAATVFILVSEIPKQAHRPVPSFLFTEDEANDQIQIRTRSDGSDWNRVQFGGSDTTFSFRFAGVTQAVPATEWRTVASASDPIEAGDVVKFCRPDGASAVSLQVRDLQTSTVITNIQWDQLSTTC